MLGTQHVGINLSEVIDYVEPRMRSSRVTFLEFVPDMDRLKIWATDPARALATSDQFDWSKGSALSEETKELLKRNFEIPDVLLEKLTSESCRAVATFDMNRYPGLSLDYQMSLLARVLGVEQKALDTTELRALAEEADLAGRFKTIWNCNMDFMAQQKSSAKDLIPRLVAKYRAGTGRPGEDLPMEGVALRNLAWLEVLAPEMEKGGVFVGVGVGHFHGPNGLIKLLRARGFNVTRFPHPED